MVMNARMQELNTMSQWDFSDLRAMIVNCTLKPSPEVSNTAGLLEIPKAILEGNGVAVDEVRAVDHELPPGVYPDMREHGWDRDDWPGHVQPGGGGRHPDRRHPHLAGGEVVGLHAG